MVHKNTKKITVYAMCISLAFLLSYLEAMLPVSGMVPGMKLGLTNLIVLFALYYLGHRAAFFVNVVRILLVALTYGTMVSFCFSLSGGMASFFVMWLLKKTGWFHIVAVSVAGGVFHNLGQIVVAAILLQTTAVAWYFGVLCISGVVSGGAIGVLAGVVLSKLPRKDSLL